MKYNIGDVLKSNSYGEYEIIGYIKSKSYNIKFLKTEDIKWILNLKTLWNFI